MLTTPYMSLALELAARGRATVSPNPMAGCVIVKDNQIIGQGYHQRAGEPHAEVYALQQAGEAARGAIAYVTLEPCCHYGRTPPCTQALIKAGIRAVHIACLDPNALVAGKGVAALSAEGIAVSVGECEQAAQALNEIFFHYITHKRPFVIAKWAMSLDGKTITSLQDSKKISGEEAHAHAHHIRQSVDAILVGANTARLDNPQLTVRDVAVVKQPLRIVLTSEGALPLDLNLFDSMLPGKTLIVTTKKCRLPQNDQIEILQLPKNEKGQVDLNSLLVELGRRQIISLLVEGGRKIHESFFAEKLVNKVQCYLAPVIISGLDKKIKVTSLQSMRIGEDSFFEGNFNV